MTVLTGEPSTGKSTLLNQIIANTLANNESVFLYSGRTHQIRVHAASIGHPLLGDPIYGPKNSKIKCKGQTLHARKLGFIHPTTKQYVEFDSDLPDYFVEILNKIK